MDDIVSFIESNLRQSIEQITRLLPEVDAGPCKSLATGNRMGAMTLEVLFTAALQLEGGWKVRECRFEGEPRQLLLKLDIEDGKRFSCPQCGKLCPTHDTSTKQ